MKHLKVFLCISLFLHAIRSEEEEVHLKDEDLYPRKDGYVVLDEHNFLAALHRFRFVLAFYRKRFKFMTKYKPKGFIVMFAFS